jgi:hypothetical protein
MQRTPPPVPVRLRARAFAAFASLRLAIVLLSLFTACLAAATLIESRYDAKVAQDLVYRAWWFGVLLALLAANVLCAALKKYPWKRYQTGFLITHAGLLILLFGAGLTVLFGVEGQMVLVDTANPELHAFVGLTNSADAIYLADRHQIEVYRLQRPDAAETQELLRLVEAIDRGEEASAGRFAQRWAFTFRPGSFAWHTDDSSQLPRWLRLLQVLADPCPEVAWDLPDGAVLSVENFVPHLNRTSTILCRLTKGARSESFEVGLSRRAARVLVDGGLYLVRYRPEILGVSWKLTLLRARQSKGPGTDRPESFQSDVSVSWPDHRAARKHNIAMNQPLSAGPYKVYQANYQMLLDPSTRQPLLDDGQPVSLSGLAVARDPGLWFKYAGSIIVVLGIAVMFYMKAYFFRPN